MSTSQHSHGAYPVLVEFTLYLYGWVLSNGLKSKHIQISGAHSLHTPSSLVLYPASSCCLSLLQILVSASSSPYDLWALLGFCSPALWSGKCLQAEGKDDARIHLISSRDHSPVLPINQFLKTIVPSVFLLSAVKATNPVQVSPSWWKQKSLMELFFFHDKMKIRILKVFFFLNEYIPPSPKF